MTDTILITGTSSGYGRATAQLFLDHGWNVIAAMRRPDPAVFAPSPRLKLVAMDVTRPESIDEAISEGLDAFGAIDVLVNNAGIGLASAVEVTPDATIREVFETNTFGTMATCRAIIPQMRRQGRGVIINVTSSTGFGPMPLVAVYAASKTAVEGFTESLSYELHGFGITARLVEPGLAPTTNFGQNAGTRMQGMIPPHYQAYAAAYFARMSDYPTPYCSETEVAEAVLAAATDEGRRIRYPAGADSRMLAELRHETSEAHYLARMREMFDPATYAPETLA
ncbi:MAG: SDR family oxidoreductase [Rhodobacteraceae bacterium]|nr:SDR family oxidoreductase [Paracoccaceae bacterium]MBR9822552.1 SDR family oxidoreductase [Paracoccaceae bacterium]